MHPSPSFLLPALRPLLAGVVLGGCAVCAQAQSGAPNADSGVGAGSPVSAGAYSRLREAVMATERAFAKTMADRDLAAFESFLSADTVFQGGHGPLRGPSAVLAAWGRFFDGPQAPFSWEPDQVLVMSDGHLALSAGPVRDPSGRLVGRFNSVWRQEAPGVWRIVLDMGSEACECRKP